MVGTQPSVLVVTNMYPTERSPAAGAFVRDQVESLRVLGLSVDLLLVDRLEEGRGAYRQLPGRLIARLAEARYDLIHVMYGGVMAEAVTRAASVPVVISFCGSDLNGTPAAPMPARLSARYGVWQSHRAARRSAAIITKSQSLAARLPTGIDPSKVFVIPNGVDLTVFTPRDRAACQADLGWSSERRYVLTYGRDSGKRVDLARRAVDVLNGSSTVPVELKVLGGVSHDHVPIWLNASHAFLLASVREGSPNVVKEALACNIPVISTDVGDVRERIAGIEGCAIVPADAEAMARGLQLAVNGDGRVAGVDAVRDLSVGAMARRVRGVYEFTLGRSSR
jgi:teichuronic acid biosynthesis glycosyltransferase TuaC